MTISEEKFKKSTQEATEIWMDSLPSNEELPNPEFSVMFQEKIQKQLRGQQRSGKWQFWRYAAVALVTLIISVAGTYTYSYAAISSDSDELMAQIQSLDLQMQENGETLDALTMQLEDLIVTIVSLETEGNTSEDILSELKEQQALLEDSILSQEEMLVKINETLESLQEQLESQAE